MRKIVSAFICALLVCTLLFTSIFWIGEVLAQSTPKKPAIPEFTLTFVVVDREISPPTQHIDPYTGETVTQPGHREQYEAIEIKVKNQKRPDNIEGNELYYDIRTKGYYEQNWRPYHFTDYAGYKQSDGTYTTLLIRTENYPDGAKVDVQVETQHGYFWYKTTDLFTSYYVFEGETSGWSNTQTITISRESNEVPNQTEPTPNPTYTPDQPPQSDQLHQTEMRIAGFSLLEFSLGIVLGIVITGLIIAVGYAKNRPARHKQTAQT